MEHIGDSFIVFAEKVMEYTANETYLGSYGCNKPRSSVDFVMAAIIGRLLDFCFISEKEYEILIQLPPESLNSLGITIVKELRK